MKRVLLIEDHIDTLESYRVALSKSKGIEAVGVTTGAEGVELFEAAQKERRAFDLVITDLMIDTQHSGVSVIRKIRSLSPDCRIVLATGRKDDHIVFMAREMKILAVWYKPISDFAQKVEEVFAMPSNVTEDRRKGFFSRHFNAINQAKQGTLILIVLCAVLAMQIRSTWMAPRLYSQIGALSNAATSMNKKLDGAVSTAALPSGCRVVIPAGKQGYRTMAPDSEGKFKSRILLEDDGTCGEQFKSLANQRGEAFYVQFTRIGR